MDFPDLGTFSDLAGVDYVNSLSNADWDKYANAIMDKAKGSGAGSTIASLLGAGILQGTGLLGGGSPQKSGYQGGIPRYEPIRQQVPQASDPNRRPGSGGRQYFTNTRYVPAGDETGIATALQQATQQANAFKAANTNPDMGMRTQLISEAQRILPSGIARPVAPPKETAPEQSGNDIGDDIPSNPPAAPPPAAPEQPEYINDLGGGAHGGLVGYAQGGIANLGYYLGGATDGMADKIPASIGDKQQAKLSHGEFVIPADIVSALGSGNSSAGAKVLYSMMDRVRQHAHGTKKQIKPANLKKTLPA